MGTFLSDRHAGLTPYVPGEQPLDAKGIIKLNTNEAPFSPTEGVKRAVLDAAKRLQLYPDTDARALCARYAQILGIAPEEILAVNGSDEALYFAFLAYGDDRHPMAFPDITYGFYEVYARLNHIPARVIPLTKDFRVNPEDYLGIGANIVIANPNAPTGVSLPVKDIETIVRANPDNIVVIDEAYVDFGGESCVGLIKNYENLIVTHTFSKSRALAGARLGFAIGCEARIRELRAIKNSINPYNVNMLTQAAGLATLDENDLYMRKARQVARVRDKCQNSLDDMGFQVLPSRTNFLFFRHEALSGDELCAALREKGILVRHFSAARTAPFVRMSMGTSAQMERVLREIRAILDAHI